MKNTQGLLLSYPAWVSSASRAPQHPGVVLSTGKLQFLSDSRVLLLTLQLLGSHKANEGWALKNGCEHVWKLVSWFFTTDLKNVFQMARSKCFRLSAELSLAPSQVTEWVAEESKHWKWRFPVFYKRLHFWIETEDTNPHSDELAERGGRISSFVLKGSEFHLHGLQISQEQKAKLVLRVLYVLSYPQPTPLVEELCAAQVLCQAHGKGQLPPPDPVHRRWQTRSSGWISAVVVFTPLFLLPIQ